MSWCPIDSSYLFPYTKYYCTICWDTGLERFQESYRHLHLMKIGIYNIEDCGQSGVGEIDFRSGSVRDDKDAPNEPKRLNEELNHQTKANDAKYIYKFDDYLILRPIFSSYIEHYYV